MRPTEPNFVRRVPEGDTLPRDVCDTCGHIAYANPKIVTGAVAAHAGRVLMCRRAIEPRRGFWTIPAGYLEEHETAEAGARREAREEANADIAIEQLLAVYSIPRISQVQLIYRAVLTSPHVSPGQESLETALLTWDEIPWGDLAFPSVRWALQHWQAAARLPAFPPFGNPE